MSAMLLSTFNVWICYTSVLYLYKMDFGLTDSDQIVHNVMKFL